MGADAHAFCMHIFHLENVCEDTVCYTVSLAQEGETDGEIVWNLLFSIVNNLELF